MLRFGGNAKDGTRLIGIGLTPKNIERLLAGEPINYRAPTSTPGDQPIDILIMFGETGEKMQAEIEASGEKQPNAPTSGATH